METKDIKNLVLVVPAKGADLLVFRGGEQVAAIGFAGGLHRATTVLNYFPDDCDFELGAGMAAVTRASGAQRPLVPMRMSESGANPDFQPVRLTDGEARLAGIVKGLQKKVNSMARRAKDAERKAAMADPLMEQPEKKPAKEQPKKAEDAPQGESGAGKTPEQETELAS